MAEVAAAPEPDAAPGEPLPPSGAEDALPSLPSSDAHEDAPAPPVDAMAPEALDEAVAAAIQEAARASPREEPTEPAAAPAAAPEASGAAAEEAVAEPADELSRLRARVEQLEAEKKAMLDLKAQSEEMEAALEEELRELRSEVASRSQELQAAQTLLASLKVEYERRVGELEAERDMLEKLSQEGTIFREKYERAQDALAEVREQLGKRINEANAETIRLRNHLETLDGEKKALERRLQQAESTVSSLEQDARVYKGWWDYWQEKHDLAVEKATILESDLIEAHKKYAELSVNLHMAPPPNEPEDLREKRLRRKSLSQIDVNFDELQVTPVPKRGSASLVPPLNLKGLDPDPDTDSDNANKPYGGPQPPSGDAVSSSDDDEDAEHTTARGDTARGDAAERKRAADSARGSPAAAAAAAAAAASAAGGSAHADKKQSVSLQSAESLASQSGKDAESDGLIKQPPTGRGGNGRCCGSRVGTASDSTCSVM